jgi:hypothetical protein
MSLWSRFFGKRSITSKNMYEFTDEDRETSADVRRAKAELKRMQYEKEKMIQQIELERTRAELRELQEELYDYDEETEVPVNTPETMLMQMLMNAFSTNNLNKDTTTTSTYTASDTDLNNNNKISMTDEQLMEMAKQIPKKYLVEARKMNDDMLINLLKSKLPNCDDDTINRAFNLIKKI